MLPVNTTPYSRTICNYNLFYIIKLIILIIDHIKAPFGKRIEGLRGSTSFRMVVDVGR